MKGQIVFQGPLNILSLFTHKRRKTDYSANEIYGKNKEVNFKWDAGTRFKSLWQIAHMCRGLTQNQALFQMFYHVLFHQILPTNPGRSVWGCISPILQVRKRRHRYWWFVNSPGLRGWEMLELKFQPGPPGPSRAVALTYSARCFTRGWNGSQTLVSGWRPET